MSSSCNAVMHFIVLIWSIKHDFEVQAYPEVSVTFTAKDRKQYSSLSLHIIVSLPSLVSPVGFAATGLCCFLVGVQCFVCVWGNKHT